MSAPVASCPADEGAKKTEANECGTGEGDFDIAIEKGGSSQPLQSASSTKVDAAHVENGGEAKWKGKGKKRSASGEQIKKQGDRSGKKARRTNEASKNEAVNNYRGSSGHHGRIPDRSAATTGSFKSYYVRRGGAGDDESNKHKQRVDDTRLPVLQKFLEALPFRPNVLDIGCNDGTLTLQVAELSHVKQVTGLDLDKELVKRARGTLRQLVFNKVDEDKRKRKEETANRPISASTRSAEEQRNETGGNIAEQNEYSSTKPKPSTDLSETAQSSSKQHNPIDVEKTTPIQTGTNVVGKNGKTEMTNGTTVQPEKDSIKNDTSKNRNTVERVSQEQTVSGPSSSPSLSLSSVAPRPATSNPGLTTKHQQQDQVLASSMFPYNVTFHLEDFVTVSASTSASSSFPASASASSSASTSVTQPNSQLQSEWHHHNKYDIVLCLSVTKWVHLKHGDAGLEQLFRRTYACLKPGGWLILEPQMTRSYKQARRKGLAPKDFDLGRCRLKPNLFRQFLLQNVGFAHVSVLRDVQKGQEYNRPIFAFYKDSHGRLPVPSGPVTTVNRNNNSNINGNVDKIINDKISTTSRDVDRGSGNGNATKTVGEKDETG